MNWHEFHKLNVEHFTFHPQYKHSGTCANRKYLQTYTVINSWNANIIHVES